MVVLISGKQGSGKTATADALRDSLVGMGILVHRVRFAQVIYEMHDKCREVLKRYGITKYDYTKKDGNLLQQLGTEWGRETIYDDVWVDCGKNSVMKFLLSMINVGQKGVAIVDDARFENEFDCWSDIPHLTVRLEAPEEVRKARAEMWRENATHPSEVGLDGYAAAGKFDITVDTHKYDLETNVKWLTEKVYGELTGAGISKGTGV